MSNQELRRARTTSIILGLAAIISILFLVYALQQKSRADKLQTEVDSLKQQVETMKLAGDSLLLK